MDHVSQQIYFMVKWMEHAFINWNVINWAVWVWILVQMVLVCVVSVRIIQINYLLFLLFKILKFLFKVQLKCGGISNQNVSYFQNPGFPVPFKDKLGCTLTIDLNPNVKQVLLDLLIFEVRLQLSRTFLI